MLQHFLRALRVVAHQYHVTAGGQCAITALGIASRLAGSLHAQIVTENNTVKVQPLPQHLLQPIIGEPRRCRTDLAVNNMCRHYAIKTALDQCGEWSQVLLLNFGHAALVHRKFKVRIGLDPAVTGEMLAGCRHSRLVHARHHASGQLNDCVGIGTKGTVTDNAALSPVQIQYRREADVDIVLTQLCGEQPTQLMGTGDGMVRIDLPTAPQSGHRRQAGKALTKALYTTAFLIYGHQQIRPQSAHRCHQRLQLGRVFIVAAEQNQTANLGTFQLLGFSGSQNGSLNIKHQNASSHALLFYQNFSAGRNLLIQFEQVVITHPNTAVRQGDPHRLGIRCAVYVDVATLCIDPTAAVETGLKATQPKNACQYPIGPGIAQSELGRIHLAGETATDKNRADGSPAPDAGTNVVSPTRSTAAAIALTGTRQCS